MKQGNGRLTLPVTVRKEKGLSLGGPAVIELLQTVLSKGRPFRFRAKGFSMSPFIKDRDIITVYPLNGIKPGMGEIVAFVHPYSNRLVVHRIVGKRENRYLIKGDNLPGADALVPERNILGRVQKVERDGSEVILGLGTERFLIVFFSLRRFFPRLRRLLRPFLNRLKQ